MFGKGNFPFVNSTRGIEFYPRGNFLPNLPYAIAFGPFRSRGGSEGWLAFLVVMVIFIYSFGLESVDLSPSSPTQIALAG